MQRRQFLRAAGVGALGGVAAPVAAQEDGEADGAAEAGGGGGGTETVIVGPDGDFTFEPESLPIQPGTTVVWEWDSNFHNVNPTSIPEDASWQGHQPTEDAGFTYEYTFDVEGTYEYQCDPHADQGMVGDVVVDPDAGTGGEAADPTVPASAMGLAIGIAGAMTSAVGATFLLLKYGRGSEPE